MSSSVEIPGEQFASPSKCAETAPPVATSMPTILHTASPSPSTQTLDKEAVASSSNSSLLTTPHETSPKVSTNTLLPSISAHILGKENTEASSTTTSSLPTTSLGATSFAPLPAFTLFPRFPLELRLRVWKNIDDFSAHEIRVTVTTPSKDSIIRKRPTFKLHSPIPIILHVNHESRIQGLQTYKTIFKVKDRNGVERDEIYFGPALDSVFVSIPRCTRDWIIYTGGHIHLPRSDIITPFDPKRHNILRCQISSYLSPGPRLSPKEDSKTIVVVQPTNDPLKAQSNERTTKSFESLAMVAGDAWKSVEFYVWKPEWWAEHWEFLFSELVKEDPEESKRRKKARDKRGKSRRRHIRVGW
jgi:hypothetical protein